MPRVLAVLVVCLAACGDNPDFPPAAEILPPSYTICSVDDDCAAFEIGCCDVCNGGTLLALRADTPIRAIEPYLQTCPRNVGCTQVGCERPAAVCVERTCEIEGASSHVFTR